MASSHCVGWDSGSISAMDVLSTAAANLCVSSVMICGRVRAVVCKRSPLVVWLLASGGCGLLCLHCGVSGRLSRGLHFDESFLYLVVSRQDCLGNSLLGRRSAVLGTWCATRLCLLVAPISALLAGGIVRRLHGFCLELGGYVDGSSRVTRRCVAVPLGACSFFVGFVVSDGFGTCLLLRLVCFLSRCTVVVLLLWFCVLSMLQVGLHVQHWQSRR